MFLEFNHTTTYLFYEPWNCSNPALVVILTVDEKKNRYTLFVRKPFTKEEVRGFLGCFFLLRIHKAHNYQKTWSESRAQYHVCLQELMTCQIFELIEVCFCTLSTTEEEEASKEDQLWKIQPLYDHIKYRCFDLYQPLQHLSVSRWENSKKQSTFFSIWKISQWNGDLSIGL